jgi:hypothetical protein
MIGVFYSVLAMLVPSARDLYRHRIDLKINCWTNILDGPLSWKERETGFEQLSILYYEKYILDNVDEYEGYPYLFDLNVTESENDEHYYLIEFDH